MKTKLSKSSKRALSQWTRAIDKTLKTGKGKYKTAWVCDLHDWKSLIKDITSGNTRKACYRYHSLDTASQEVIPTKIQTILEKS